MLFPSMSSDWLPFLEINMNKTRMFLKSPIKDTSLLPCLLFQCQKQRQQIPLHLVPHHLYHLLPSDPAANIINDHSESMQRPCWVDQMLKGRKRKWPWGEKVMVCRKSIYEDSGKGVSLLHSKKVKGSLALSQLVFAMHFRSYFRTK